LKCLSNIIIVIHPANTGSDPNNKKEVKNILQGNKGMNNALCKTERQDAFNEVTIKLISFSLSSNVHNIVVNNPISIACVVIFGL
jgi:hypothetical protein